MTEQEHIKRRALIVRRQVAQRMRRVQQEIWRRRRAAQAGDLDESTGADGDLLADLSEGLLG